MQRANDQTVEYGVRRKACFGLKKLLESGDFRVGHVVRHFHFCADLAKIILVQQERIQGESGICAFSLVFTRFLYFLLERMELPEDL